MKKILSIFLAFLGLAVSKRPGGGGHTELSGNYQSNELLTWVHPLVFSMGGDSVSGGGSGGTECCGDLNDILSVCWTLDMDAETFEATLTLDDGGNTDKWILFGFSEGGGMVDADVVVSFWGKDVMQYNILGEDFDPEEALELDGSQDLQSQSRRESGGIVTVSFSRKSDTGDSADIILEAEEMELIWAYDDGSVLQYHRASNRGELNVNIGTCEEGSEPGSDSGDGRGDGGRGGDGDDSDDSSSGGGGRDSGRGGSGGRPSTRRPDGGGRGDGDDGSDSSR